LVVKRREHIASVLCVTSTASPDSSDRKMIISGGEDSIIQVTSVASDGGSGCTPPDDSSTGEGHDRVARIDHHRGPVTCAVVNHRNDVLVSGRLSPHEHFIVAAVVTEKLYNLSLSCGAFLRKSTDSAE
jgi:WD40 repeat protein